MSSTFGDNRDSIISSDLDLEMQKTTLERADGEERPAMSVFASKRRLNKAAEGFINFGRSHTTVDHDLDIAAAKGLDVLMGFECEMVRRMHMAHQRKLKTTDLYEELPFFKDIQNKKDRE